MNTQTFSINNNQNEVVRNGNFAIMNGKVVLTTCVYVWNSRTSQSKGLSNSQIEFDLNSDYDASVSYFEEIISGYYSWDRLTFDENIFDGDVIDDQLVDSFVTFACELNDLNRKPYWEYRQAGDSEQVFKKSLQKLKKTLDKQLIYSYIIYIEIKG